MDDSQLLRLLTELGALHVYHCVSLEKYDVTNEVHQLFREVVKCDKLPNWLPPNYHKTEITLDRVACEPVMSNCITTYEDPTNQTDRHHCDQLSYSAVEVAQHEIHMSQYLSVNLRETLIMRILLQVYPQECMNHENFDLRPPSTLKNFILEAPLTLRLP